MKKILLSFAYILIAGITAWSQAPGLMNYQGVARNSSGTPLASATISLRLTIHDGSGTGTVDYQETQSVTTNTFGLFNVAIGGGTIVSGTFSGISWGSSNKWLQVEIDPSGGSSYTTLGTSELLSVPYALYAASSPSGGGGSVTAVTAGAGLLGGTITTTGTISMPNVGTAGTYGSATQVPVITTDAQGRVTSVTSATISGGGGITSTGTANYIPMFTSATAIGNSGFYQNGTKIGLGTLTPLSTIDATSTTDTMAGFFASSSATAPGHGMLRAEYDGTADAGYGIIGTTINAIANNNTFGILGGGTKIGVNGLGETSTTSSTSEVTGVEGDAYSNGYLSIGVGGYAYRYSSAPTYCIGIYGDELDAVTAGTAGTANYAGYFDGDVYINGTLSKAGGTFKIDDPMDPDNKYLTHSFVESPDMMNVYNGNITTDATGSATVTLPAYFETLNKDFRYQLTVIGTFAQAIVGEKVHDNQFVIKTSVPNVEVSWQVTGIRQDAWANAHRVVPEIEKESFNKGKYLNATELGKPASQQIGHFKPTNDKNAKNAVQPINTGK